MTPNVENILLTGFRATGKTMVGAILAERMGKQFIDTDQEICTHAQLSIDEMVTRFGWKYFRDREALALQGLLKESNVVAAVGGGAIEHQQLWLKLREKYFIVWLQADKDTIFQRMQKDLKSAQQRPSLTGNSLYEEIQQLLEYRNPMYRNGSDLAMDTTTASPQLLAEKIAIAMKGRR